MTGARHDVPIDRYQVYGERCSGTNFVIRLLERNVMSARFTEAFGHKHWYVKRARAIPANCLVLVVARNPHDWLRSFHRKPWHVAAPLNRLPFSQFIRQQWVAGESVTGEGPEPLRERHPVTRERFANVLELRRVKLEHWMSLRRFAHVTVLPVAYETVYRQQTLFLDTLANRFGWTLRPQFAAVATYKGEQTSDYVPRQYPPISVDDRRYIDSQLDPQLERLWFDSNLQAVRRPSDIDVRIRA